MSAAFDNTILSVLLNPNGNIPFDPATGQPVVEAKARAEAVIHDLQKARRKIILPAPACAELLTAIGPEAQQYLNVVGRSRVFEVASFDARCAAELALLNRGEFKQRDEEVKAEPYQKRKVDRQIVAIAKVYGASEIYTDDSGLAKLARLCGITPVSIAEIPLPEAAKQIPLALEPHDAIPAADDAA